MVGAHGLDVILVGRDLQHEQVCAHGCLHCQGCVGREEECKHANGHFALCLPRQLTMLGCTTLVHTAASLTAISYDIMPLPSLPDVLNTIVSAAQQGAEAGD